MKAIIPISLVFVSLLCFAQTEDLKLYAYKQTSLPGLPSSEDSVEAKALPGSKKEPSVTYLIYVTFTAKKNIDPLEIWINGEPFRVEQELIKKTPIEFTYDNNSIQPQKMLLVPFTQNDVLQLKPIEKIPGKTSLPKKSLAKTNELIVVYKESGKVKSKIVKKIKNLPAALRQ